MVFKGDEKVKEKKITIVFGIFVAITAVAVVASGIGLIPEGMCFIAMTGTFLVGMGIAGKIIVAASQASGGN